MEQQQYCGYCQRFRAGTFRLTGNKGLTRICANCYLLRREQSKRTAQDLPLVNKGKRTS
jgi:hypothetical protein